MFNDNSKKKKIILGISIGLFILVLILLLLLFRDKDKPINFLGIDINGGVGSNLNLGTNTHGVGGNNSTNSNNSSDSSVDIIIPSKKINAKVSNIDIKGSYGQLDLLDGENTTTVELKIGGIVFDTTKNKVISTNDIKKGTKVAVYTYSDVAESKLDTDLVEVLILSPKDNMGYVPIENFKSDNNSIEFSSKGKEYKIEGTIYSALSGKEYDERQLSELENGDRVIYYGKEKDNKVIIEKAYVYPNFN